MLDGYKLGFELYRQDSGKDASKDTLVATIQPADLHAAQTALDSALTSLDKPGDYYWVWVFQKADGSRFPASTRRWAVLPTSSPSKTARPACAWW